MTGTGDNPDTHGGNEGLRERKKRILRQRISDTATGMFLERGFDEVKVSEIAEACDVSEKTIYNYFPTKESLLFDREEDQARQIAEALRDRGDDVSIVDSVVAVLERELQWIYRVWSGRDDDAEGLVMIRRFAAMIESTPALTAGMQVMMDRLTEVAAIALAERAGVDPEDPEPQMAATIVIGLWRTQFNAMQRYTDGSYSPDEVLHAVLDDIRRAASVADSGLSSFTAVIGPNSTKDQLREAAESADLARKQVVTAMKQAKAAWKEVMLELHTQWHGDESWPTDRRERERQMHQRQNEMRSQIRSYQQELRQQRIHQHAEAREQRARAKRAKRGR